MNKRRDQLIRDFLCENGLSCWIAWRPDELVMMAGHMPYWGVSLLIYPSQGAPILFRPELEPMDHNLPEGIRVLTYPWGRMDCPDPFAVLLESMEREFGGCLELPVGYSRGNERSSLPVLCGEIPPFPTALSERFGLLSRGGSKESTAAFHKLYLIKTEAEIAAIRLTNRIAKKGLARFFESLRPGVTEAEVAAAVESAIHCTTGREGVHHARGFAMVQSGPNSADGGCFNRSSGRRLEEGDPVMIELCTCVNGYWSDLTRSGSVGKISGKMAEVQALVAEAQAAAIGVVRPGVTAHAVDAAARAAVIGGGFGDYFRHATGHHTGFRYHDPGFALCPGEYAVLEEGMVLTIEPGVYGEELGGGSRIEDNILVTATGAENLSHD